MGQSHDTLEKQKRNNLVKKTRKQVALSYNHPHSYERMTLIPSEDRTLKGSPSPHKAPTLRRFCCLSALTGQSQAPVAEGKFGVKLNTHAAPSPFPWRGLPPSKAPCFRRIYDTLYLTALK